MVVTARDRSASARAGAVPCPCRSLGRPLVLSRRAGYAGSEPRERSSMSHPVIHAEIRSADAKATRAFFRAVRLDVYGRCVPRLHLCRHRRRRSIADCDRPAAGRQRRGALLHRSRGRRSDSGARGATWRADDPTASGGSGRDVRRLRRSAGSRRRRGGELGAVCRRCGQPPRSGDCRREPARS